MPFNILAGNLVNMLREGNLSFLCSDTAFPGFEMATMKSSDICKGNQIETEGHFGCNVNFSSSLKDFDKEKEEIMDIFFFFYAILFQNTQEARFNQNSLPMFEL